MSEEKAKFLSTMNKGFRMTFDNGITASVQWGPGNYCDVKSYSPGSWDMPMTDPSKCWGSGTAEVAAWDKGNVYVTKKVMGGPEMGDDVVGHLTPNEVLDFLNKCSKL